MQMQMKADIEQRSGEEEEEEVVAYGCVDGIIDTR